MDKKERLQTTRPPAGNSKIRIRRTGAAEQRRKDRALAGFRDMLKAPVSPVGGDLEPEDDDSRRWIMRSEWEKPDPSTSWRGASGVAVAIAATAILAALTVSKADAPTVSLAWAIGIAALLAAGVCLLAHLDVNRGRKAKRSEVIEEDKGSNSR
jgi:hypothetical protein